MAVLEADGGVAAPTDSPLLDGRWRLLFTTRPGTASPIQRTFTAVESFKSELAGLHWRALWAARTGRAAACRLVPLPCSSARHRGTTVLPACLSGSHQAPVRYAHPTAAVYQDIDLTEEQPRVCQVVDFGKK